MSKAPVNSAYEPVARPRHRTGARTVDLYVEGPASGLGTEEAVTKPRLRVLPPRVAAAAASLGCDVQRLRRKENAAFATVTLVYPEGVRFHSPGLARERLPRASSCGSFETASEVPGSTRERPTAVGSVSRLEPTFPNFSGEFIPRRA